MSLAGPPPPKPAATVYASLRSRGRSFDSSLILGLSRTGPAPLHHKLATSAHSVASAPYPPSQPKLPPGNAAIIPARLRSADASLSSFPSVSPSLTSFPQLPSNMLEPSALEPSVDGPPSPESIRAVNRQVRRASILGSRHISHSTTNSSASSLSSGHFLSDHSEWPARSHSASTGAMTPSRRSSASSGSMLNMALSSRHHPESPTRHSPTTPGRSFFRRRRSLSSNFEPSTSNFSVNDSQRSSHIYTDVPAASKLASTPGARDSFSSFSSILGRLKTVKSEVKSEAATAKKPQISRPFNFRHLTHTRREQVMALHRASRPDPTENRSRSSSVNVLPVGIRSSMSLYSFGMSSESICPEPRVRSSRSHEHLHVSPPRPSRPPRPPFEPTLAAFQLGPVPPPRISSRLSLQYSDLYSLTTSVDRPLTAGGFRRSQPFRPDDGIVSSAASSLGPGFVPEMIVTEPQKLPLLTIANDTHWPLIAPLGSVSFETDLPDVPEEDEQSLLLRQSRVSLTSPNSFKAVRSVPSLRLTNRSSRESFGVSSTPSLPSLLLTADLESTMGSNHEQAVPLVRRGSAASDTLGFSFDDMAKPLCEPFQCPGANMALDLIARENWEDAVDFCYEHEAMDDFDFDWNQVSVETSSSSESYQPMTSPMRLCTSGFDGSLLRAVPSHADLPALSPASLTSTASPIEAATPIIGMPPAAAVLTNFSLPRLDASSLKPVWQEIQSVMILNHDLINHPIIM